MTASAVATLLTTPDTRPFSIVSSAGGDLYSAARLQNISVRETADHRNGSITFRAQDPASNVVIPSESTVIMVDNALGAQRLMAVVRSRQVTKARVGRTIDITAVDVAVLLDEILIPFEERPVESDRTRLLYLWGKYAREPLAFDMSQVAQLNASVSADVLQGLTLRTAIERVADLAASTAKYYVDGAGRLHYFSSEPALVAPYVIHADAPTGAQISPQEIDIDSDSFIKNVVYVHGATGSGSGWFQDNASIASYGRRETYIEAPSSDSQAKAALIAQLYFGRVAQPRVRGSFLTNSPKDGWQAGQTVTVTSAAHGLTAATYPITELETTFMEGSLGVRRRYRVSFGEPGASSVSMLGGVGSSATPIAGSNIAGALADPSGNAIVSAIIGAGSDVGFGPAVRRWILSGLYNGDFFLPPTLGADSQITTWNQLPYWAYTTASGTAIKAYSFVDTGSGSGRVIRWLMEAGAAGDDAYLQQIVPINASRTRSTAYVPRYSTRTPTTGTPLTNIEFESYIEGQYLKSDGVTTTGAASLLATLCDNANDTTADLDLGLLAGWNGHPPADAYFLRLRLGIRRKSGGSTTAIGEIHLTEAGLDAGQPFTVLPELTDPATYRAGLIYQTNGILVIRAEGDISNPSKYVSTINAPFVGSNSLKSTMSAGDSFAATVNVWRVNQTSTVTLTSTPTVSDGRTDGQRLLILNVGTNALTLQDQGTLANSNIRLSAATIAIGPRDSLELMWSSDIADWVQVGTTNVI